MTADQIRQLRPRLDEYLGLFDDCFAHADTRAHPATYVAGQLSDLPRKETRTNWGLNFGVGLGYADLSHGR